MKLFCHITALVFLIITVLQFNPALGTETPPSSSHSKLESTQHQSGTGEALAPEQFNLLKTQSGPLHCEKPPHSPLPSETGSQRDSHEVETKALATKLNTLLLTSEPGPEDYGPPEHSPLPSPSAVMIRHDLPPDHSNTPTALSRASSMDKIDSIPNSEISKEFDGGIQFDRVDHTSLPGGYSPFYDR